MSQAGEARQTSWQTEGLAHPGFLGTGKTYLQSAKTFVSSGKIRRYLHTGIGPTIVRRTL